MLRTLLVTLAVFAVTCVALVLWQPALLNIPRVIMLVREEPVLPYPVPVQGVRTSQLTDQWGAPRSGGRKHQGIDIFASCGTPVLSATHGLVTRIGTNMLGGQIVRVLGPGGYWHYYAHLSEFGDIKEGQLVTAGTVPRQGRRHGQREGDALPPALRRVLARGGRREPLSAAHRPARRLALPCRAPSSAIAASSQVRFAVPSMIGSLVE